MCKNSKTFLHIEVHHSSASKYEYRYSPSNTLVKRPKMKNFFIIIFSRREPCPTFYAFVGWGFFLFPFFSYRVVETSSAAETFFLNVIGVIISRYFVYLFRDRKATFKLYSIIKFSHLLNFVKQGMLRSMGDGFLRSFCIMEKLLSKSGQKSSGRRQHCGRKI